jgi:hypothetical protein
VNLTFAGLLTPEGVVIAAGVVTSLVALIKAVFPVINERVSGALMAFVLTALLYLAAITAIPLATPDAFLGLFLAWLACATAAVVIHSTVQHVAAQRAG